jgi:hypothetical protein
MRWRIASINDLPIQESDVQSTRSANANTTGYWVVVPMIIPDCPTLIFEKPEQRQYF